MLKHLALAVVLTAGPASAFAQSQPAAPIQKVNTTKATLTITAIDQKTRSVTLRAANGDEDTFTVGPAVQRFNQLKVGDKINAKYYDSIVITVQDPKSAPVDTAAAKLVPVEGAPAGTMSYQRVITATITAIDPKVPSITFTGPNNWTYSSRVEDKAALSKVKVGDKVTITWTAAVLMSVEGS